MSTDVNNSSVGSFSSLYNYYDGNKHGSDYLYPITRDVLGSWKHYNRSNQTLTERNNRASSPLVSRQLDRYGVDLKVFKSAQTSMQEMPKN